MAEVAAVSGTITARVTGPNRWRVEARSPTLGGNVPLRAARSCPPFLLGNSFGLAVYPAEPIRVRRGLRSIDVTPPPLTVRSCGSKKVEITFDTRIALEADADVALSIDRAWNRRDRRVIAQCESIVPDRTLTITLEVTIGRGEALQITGEVASVGAFLRAPNVRMIDISRAPTLARAHASFFDDAYFATKRGAPTNKYKRTAKTRPAARTDAFVVAHVGGAPPTLVEGPDGILAIEIASDLDVELRYHGQRVEVALDANKLGRRAAPIERRLTSVLGHALTPGALRYFTTYVTAHAPGDPHVFFKPATLVAAPADMLLVLDGPAHEGLEGKRGVTEPSWFHALPAVAEMIAPYASVPAGSPILRARFAPRSFATPRVAWA